MTTEAKAGFYNGLGQAAGLFIAGLVGVVVGALLFSETTSTPAPIRQDTPMQPMPVGAPVVLGDNSTASLRNGNCRGYGG